MIKELYIDDKIYTRTVDILSKLREYKLFWLIDSEVHDAIIEIKNNTVIWKSGNYLYGRWHFGIFQDGEFNGIWENGIWEQGIFKGTWISGVNKPKYTK